MREGMQLGADDYLTKPFTAEELISSVNTRLSRSDSIQDEAERRMTQLRESIVLALPHELRTPLNAVLGFSEIMMTDTRTLDEEKVLDMAEHINKAAMRLYRLVENYVIYANLQTMYTDEEHVAAMRRGRTQYPAIVVAQQAEEKARQYNREADLQLSIPQVYTPLAIEGDNFSRVVTELLDNALKFSKAGTPVSVEITVDDGMMRIDIRDEGVGMTPEAIRNIGAYMQFQRSVLEQQGIGLGLVIAKRIVEIHNGLFDIQSQFGHYTQVTVALPFVPNENTNGREK
jgi:K+-sensing histidine kinase KdpD